MGHQEFELTSIQDHQSKHHLVSKWPFFREIARPATWHTWKSYAVSLPISYGKTHCLKNGQLMGYRRPCISLKVHVNLDLDRLRRSPWKSPHVTLYSRLKNLLTVVWFDDLSFSRPWLPITVSNVRGSVHFEIVNTFVASMSRVSFRPQFLRRNPMVRIVEVE